MDIDTYTKILLKQQESMTPEMLEAIKAQGELHIICEATLLRLIKLTNVQIEDIPF